MKIMGIMEGKKKEQGCKNWMKKVRGTAKANVGAGKSEVEIGQQE